MSTPFHASHVDALLEQAPYVRGLARELVFDGHLARDVEQETLLAALEHAPREPGRLRGWLAAITRNLAVKAWRSSARRERREEACARPETAVPSPEEILAREDQRRHLIERVLELEEPLRAVLVLRFFGELAPREVARRLDLPVETVRTRTKRGLAMLRERLDREGPGGRAAWCLALVRGFELPASLARVGAALAASSIAGMVVTSAARKAALATLAVALVGSVAVLVHRGGEARVGGERTSGADRVAVVPPQAAPSATEVVTLGATPARTRSASPIPQPSTQVHATAGGALLLHLAWHDGTPAGDVAAMVYSSESEDVYADAIGVRTGADGTCRIEALLPGRASVFARGDAVGSAVVVAGEEVELTLTIAQGFDVDGIVVDSGGVPVAGAEILADDSGQGWTGATVARSDEDGSFHVRSVSDGLCWLWARAPGFAPSARQVLVSGSGRALGVHLTLPAPGGNLAGTVRDEEGRPVAGAQLLVGDEDGFRHATVPEGGEAILPAARRVDADENGHFEVSGLAAGPLEVRVRARDFAPWSGTVEIDEGGTVQLAVTLQTEVAVEGSVTDGSGALLAGVEISSGRAGFLDRVTRSLADGSFALRGLPVAFELRADGERRGQAHATLTGSPGALLRWDAVLDGGLTLHGRLVGAGVDPTVCTVRCESLDPGAYSLDSAHPDAQGAFEFTGLLDAGYHIEVHAADDVFFPLSIVEDVHPGPDETQIEVDAGRWPSVHLRGRVLDAGGQLLAGASLSPLLVDPAIHNNPVLMTDADGAFDLGPYPPGRWVLLVRDGEAGELRTEPVELGAGASWDFGDLRLPR